MSGHIASETGDRSRQQRQETATGNCHITLYKCLFTNGLRQGGVLSPTLFNLIMDCAIGEVTKACKGVYVGHFNLQPVYLSTCAYADDLAVFAKSAEELQRCLNLWDVELSRLGFRINTDKTKVMVLNGDKDIIRVCLNGEPVEQVEAFQYLGVGTYQQLRWA